MIFFSRFWMLALLIPFPAFAFHEGGVANCKGCHTIHNSENGNLVDPDNRNGDPAYLRVGTASDLCLSCHATTLGSELSASPLSPAPNKGGGDFVFLKANNLNDASTGILNPIPGSAAGHNLNAPGHGLAPDGTLNRAPGGNYSSYMMSCTSCHNPHGNSNFRMLYGVGHVSQGNFTFLAPAPVASGLSVTDGSAESNNLHTAYRSGMSAWCGNCHGNYHDNGGANNTVFSHKSGVVLGGDIATIYARYNGTDFPTSGSFATAYLAQVPFEDALATVTGTQGPTATSKVMCLSCHRAHASSAPHAGRWDFNVSFLNQDGMVSGSYPIPNPYPGPNQRRLCEKCHGLGG